MHTLNLAGLNCPLPVLKTKKYLASLAPGIEVKIITTDPASVHDLSDFCDKTGHVLLVQYTEENQFISIIKHR